MYKLIESALSDIRAGIRMRQVWIALASEDIGDQHRRTTLGPLWLLINYLAFAGTFIFIFNGGPVDPSHAAYVAIGLLIWLYITETITQGVTLFLREESFIKGTTLPLTVYVMRTALQSVFRAGYALVGCLAVLLFCGVPVSVAWVWSAVGLTIIVLATPAVILIFAFLGVFFPDSQFVVANLMRVGMFLTPVFWTDTGIGGIQHAFYHYNPFTYFLDIVRVPILSGGVPLQAMEVCVGISAIAWLLALLLLGKFRRQVALVL